MIPPHSTTGWSTALCIINFCAFYLPQLTLYSNNKSNNGTSFPIVGQQNSDKTMFRGGSIPTGRLGPYHILPFHTLIHSDYYSFVQRPFSSIRHPPFLLAFLELFRAELEDLDASILLELLLRTLSLPASVLEGFDVVEFLIDERSASLLAEFRFELRTEEEVDFFFSLVPDFMELLVDEEAFVFIAAASPED